MKTGFLIVMTLMLGGSTLGAQGAGQTSGHVIQFNDSTQPGAGREASAVAVAEPREANDGCPVTMHADHLADGSMVKTNNTHPKGLGQWLNLSLTSRDAKRIAKATVTVNGLTPKERVTQALSNGAGPWDATQSLDVSFVAGPDHAAIARIWVPGMSAVMRIDLESMVYSDGSVWKIAEAQACRVRPDPLMLISGR